MKCPVCSELQNQVLTWAYPAKLVRCQSCSLVWQPRPDWDQIKHAYQQAYPDSHSRSWWWRVGVRLVNWLRVRQIKVLWPDTQTKILEVGCGEANLLFMLHQLGYKNLLGIDFASAAINKAREQHIPVRRGDIHTIQLKKHAYDLILLQQVIEHLADPRAVLIKLHQALTPGGKLIISTPNSCSWQAKLFKNNWHSWHQPFHTYVFSPTSLIQLCDQVSFSKSTLSYPVTPNDLAGSLHKIVTRRLALGLQTQSVLKMLLLGVSLPVAVVESLMRQSSRFQLIVEKAR